MMNVASSYPFICNRGIRNIISILGCGLVANSFGKFGSIFNWKFWAMAFLKDSEWTGFYVSRHTNFGGYGFGGNFFL